jgi:hypothetical protein
MVNHDITLKRFQEAARVCGLIPRLCFEVALSPTRLENAELSIINGITQCKDLVAAISDVHGDQPVPHRAFEICPSPKSRSWEACRVRPVSDWAFHQIVAALDRRDNDAAYRFYKAIQGTPDGAMIRGKLWETKVHKFFSSITRPKNFHILSLNDRSTSFDIELSSSTVRQNFESVQNFAGLLASFVKNEQSCYLKLLSPTFPTFDSFLYQHGMSQPGCQPLIGLQITDACDHPISIKGLADIETSLKPKVPELRSLRPTVARKWIILFVVPEPMATSFVEQRFKDAKKSANWGVKTTQYVLGLPEQEVMRS